MHALYLAPACYRLGCAAAGHAGRLVTDWGCCCPFSQAAEEADEAAALLARAEEALQALQTDSGAGGYPRFLIA